LPDIRLNARSRLEPHDQGGCRRVVRDRQMRTAVLGRIDLEADQALAVGRRPRNVETIWRLGAANLAQANLAR